MYFYINIELLPSQTQHLNTVVHLFILLQHVSAVLFSHHQVETSTVTNWKSVLWNRPVHNKRDKIYNLAIIPRVFYRANWALEATSIVSFSDYALVFMGLGSGAVG